jgi:hypothetical protein
MKIKKKIIILFLAAVIITVAVTVSNSLADSDPEYKLHESIRKWFRPEWVWNEETKDYENVERLERDSETGLFILPEPRKELEEYATWDGKLGLYISNDIKINHETGEVTTKSNQEPIIVFPEYIIDENSEIDQKYMAYLEISGKIYRASPASSIYYSPLRLLEKGEVSEDVFLIDVKDINLLKKKLNEGLRTDFTMTMIQVTTRVNMDNVASNGEVWNLKYWLEEYNQLIEAANKGFDAEEAKKLGILSLPYIGEQVKAGNYDAYKEPLVSLAEGYGGQNDKTGKPESYEKAVEWFEYYKDDINIIKEFISSELEADWLY